MQLRPSQGPGGPHSLAGVLLNRAQRAQRLPQDSPDYEVSPFLSHCQVAGHCQPWHA